MNDMIQYVGLIIFLFFIVYIFYRVFTQQMEGMKNREGLTNNDASKKVNHGEKAENFTNQVKSLKNTMKDKHNIPTYRTDYENLLIELNEHVDGLMLDELLSIDPTNIDSNHIVQKLDNIHKLSNGKTHLNNIMKYIDKN